MRPSADPQRQGLYDPGFEHDACGVGFVANINGDALARRSCEQGLQVLRQPDPPRRLRLRSRDRRRRRHPDPDARTRSCATRVRGGWASRCRAPGEYGVGMVFLPRRRDRARLPASSRSSEIVARGGPARARLARRAGRRRRKCGRAGARSRMPVDPPGLRRPRRAGMPTRTALERKLYVIRKRVENGRCRESDLRDREYFYVPSLSSRTHRLQGPAAARADRAASTPTWPIPTFDQRARRWCTSASAPTRSRPGTCAHPFRYIAHNGEINTLRGNVNWMHARESHARVAAVRRRPPEALPDHRAGRQRLGARSTTRSSCWCTPGRSLPHAMMMLIPEAWDEPRAHERRASKAFYEYHACLMEPWDGPASIAFTDGTRDRRRARPQRPAPVALHA